MKKIKRANKGRNFPKMLGYKNRLRHVTGKGMTLKKTKPYWTQPITNLEYHKIGKKYGLNARDTERYAKFMQMRLPKEFDRTYAGEWAGRFQRGTEYDRSDSKGERILRKIDKR